MATSLLADLTIGLTLTRSVTDGLARITVAAPKRRVDVALPESVPVTELMTVLLRSSGEGLADDGQSHGGWMLRRPNGDAIDPARSLASQEVRDGEILHLVARQDEWPEMDYDDVVDAIATGARKQSGSWGADNTQRTGVLTASAALAVGLACLVTAGPNWQMPAVVAFVAAVLMLSASFALSRAFGDSRAAVVTGTFASLYGAFGGFAILGGDQPLRDLDPAQYLVGSAALLIFSLAAFITVANSTQYFVAGIFIGFIGVIASLLCRASNIDGVDSAAIALTIVVAFTPTLPLLSIRIGKLPMPALPTSTDELLADPPQVPLERVHATVRRSDEILTGMLLGSMVVGVIAQIILVMSGRMSAAFLVGIVAATFLLRARLFPSARHRIPLLVTGMNGAAWLAIGIAATDREMRLYYVASVMLLLAGAAICAGNYFKTRQPTPYIGRIADILDVLLVLAVVPVMCLVVGLYGYLRGLYG